MSDFLSNVHCLVVPRDESTLFDEIKALGQQLCLGTRPAGAMVKKIATREKDTKKDVKCKPTVVTNKVEYKGQACDVVAPDALREILGMGVGKVRPTPFVDYYGAEYNKEKEDEIFSHGLIPYHSTSESVRLKAHPEAAYARNLDFGILRKECKGFVIGIGSTPCQAVYCHHNFVPKNSTWALEHPENVKSCQCKLQDTFLVQPRCEHWQEPLREWLSEGGLPHVTLLAVHSTYYFSYKEMARAAAAIMKLHPGVSVELKCAANVYASSSGAIADAGFLVDGDSAEVTQLCGSDFDTHRHDLKYLKDIEVPCGHATRNPGAFYVGILVFLLGGILGYVLPRGWLGVIPPLGLIGLWLLVPYGKVQVLWSGKSCLSPGVCSGAALTRVRCVTQRVWPWPFTRLIKPTPGQLVMPRQGATCPIRMVGPCGSIFVFDISRCTSSALAAKALASPTKEAFQLGLYSLSRQDEHKCIEYPTLEQVAALTSHFYKEPAVRTRHSRSPKAALVNFYNTVVRTSWAFLSDGVKKRYVNVSLRPEHMGIVAPCPGVTTVSIETEGEGLRGRVLKKCDPPAPGKWTRIYAEVHDEIFATARRVGACPVWSRQEYIQSLKGKKRTAAENAYAMIDGAMGFIGLLTYNAFIKVEQIGALIDILCKAPRIIQAPNKMWRAWGGQVIKPIGKFLARMFGPAHKWFYATGVTNADLGDWAWAWEQRLGGNCSGVCVDFSRFDSTVSRPALEIEKAVYLGLCPDNADNITKLLDAQMGECKGTTKMGLTYYVTATRKSGDPNTSCGNSLLNIICNGSFLERHHPGHYAFAVCGDDVKIILSAGQYFDRGAYDRHCLECGFKAESEVYQNSCDAGFCSKLFLEVATHTTTRVNLNPAWAGQLPSDMRIALQGGIRATYMAIPQIGRALVKYCVKVVSVNDRDMRDTTMAQERKGQALSMCPQAAVTPILGPLVARDILACAGVVSDQWRPTWRDETIEYAGEHFQGLHNGKATTIEGASAFLDLTSYMYSATAAGSEMLSRRYGEDLYQYGAADMAWWDNPDERERVVLSLMGKDTGLLQHA